MSLGFAKVAPGTNQRCPLAAYVRAGHGRLFPGVAKVVSHRILWAEDSLQDRQLIRHALLDLPRPPIVTFVADGMQLLERAAQERPNLVVLDLHMPGMDGLEALKRLRADPATRRQPVVVFSSSDRPDEVDACRRLGARDCVRKPLAFDAFVVAVERVIRSLSGQVEAVA